MLILVDFYLREKYAYRNINRYVMKDLVHTNRQRIEKIRGLIAGIRLANEQEVAHVAAAELDSLLVLAEEAEGSLDALEEFLCERRALDCKDD